MLERYCHLIDEDTTVLAQMIDHEADRIVPQNVTRSVRSVGKDS